MRDEFARLLAPHKDALERYVYYKTPSRQDGEDVLQDVYLAAAKNLSQLRDPEKFKPWILAIAANRLKAFYRTRARMREIPFEDARSDVERPDRGGRGVIRVVRETMSDLPEGDRLLLSMAYFHGMPLSEIAGRLDIPVGTVKSRLHAARRRFRALYPCPPTDAEGGVCMSKSIDSLPMKLPEVSIRRTGEAKEAFLQELMGWFIIPRVGETARWAIYDYPERSRAEAYELKAACRASVHGVEGVEIEAREFLPDGSEGTRCTMIGQLTDTHCRYLAETREVDGVKRTVTFLDDDFASSFAIGLDNCGLDVRLPAKGVIRATEGGYEAPDAPEAFDTVCRCEVKIGARTFDAALIVYIERSQDGAILCEIYADESGRCVLQRRYNSDNWGEKRSGVPWSLKLPENARIRVNGETFVHWYDTTPDTVL